jgi:enoyl-[acyl-carrier protein] reductase I
LESCRRAVEEGATITLSNTPWQFVWAIHQIGENSMPRSCRRCTNVDDLEMVFSKSVEILGGKIDFVLHSIGMSPNVRKKRTYDDLDYDMFMKTLDI